MKISPKYIKIAAITVGSIAIVLLLLMSLVYNRREKLFNIAIAKAIAKAEHDYNLRVTIKNAKLHGVRLITFDAISIVPKQRDSLLYLQKLEVGVNILPLLWGDIKLSQLKLERGKLNLVKKDSTANYDFLFRKKGGSKPSELNLSRMANNLLNQVLYKIPEVMDVQDFDIKFRDPIGTIDFYTTAATIHNNQVLSTIRVNGKQATWHVEGQVFPAKKQLNLALFAQGKAVELPYIKQKFGLKLSFDTISTQMKQVERDGSDLIISGSWAVKNLLVNHPKIASENVIIRDGSIAAFMRFEKKAIGLDSSSVIHINNITINPFIRYTIAPHKVYELKLHTPLLNAQQLFDAFPQGMFESLEGIQVAGNLQYNLHFYLDSKQPDNVQFGSSLTPNNFKIQRWGKTNLQKINSSFVYTPYELNKPMRSILIGPENQNFAPLDTISPYIKNAVLTAEDPSFFKHRGFVEESIRKSIATNFEKQAFKRGGSTISMQLVKNIYLSRQKTIARKIEEMLIVWLIENQHLVTKNRLFEVYLNLIEWGPNVYGITEASRFYFGKQPSALSIGESIFLASIVPRPKSGLHFFEPDGHLRTNLRGYFKLLGGLMSRRGIIPTDANAYGFYDVQLKESLRQASSIDTLQLETDMEDKDDLFAPIFFEHEQDSTLTKK